MNFLCQDKNNSWLNAGDRSKVGFSLVHSSQRRSYGALNGERTHSTSHGCNGFNGNRPHDESPITVGIIESELVWMGCESVSVDTNVPLIILDAEDDFSI